MGNRKVGIIGSGAVGQALAVGFKKYGFDVKIRSRDVSKLQDFGKEHEIGVGTFDEIAKHGDIMVLAVKGIFAKDALLLAGKENIRDKIIIDTTNPINDMPGVSGVIPYFTEQNASLMEYLLAEYKEANFVKAFSCVGSAFMVDPNFEEGKPSMFICGNNSHAKAEVASILYTFGWEVEDMGVAEAARAIEPLAMLWCIPGFRENKWNHAFKLLKH